MANINLSTYSREELERALSVLQAYRVSLKQIGARAHLEDPKSPLPTQLRVEYATGIQMDTVRSYAQKAA